MGLRFLLFLLLTVSVSHAHAQLVEKESKTGLTFESDYVIEGTFEYTYLETTHQIKLSSSEKTYYEFDEYGTKLGSGKFTKEGDFFLLMPEEVSTYSMINGAIEIELLSLDDVVMKVNLMLSDTTSEELELIKLL